MTWGPPPRSPWRRRRSTLRGASTASSTRRAPGARPEIDCIPVLQKVSEDYSVPVLYLTYDSQTSDTGLDTRLEAFYDMLSMKKEKSK